MNWKEVQSGDTLYDMRNGHLCEIVSARTCRGYGAPGGWVRSVMCRDVVTNESWSWDYGLARDIAPYALARRG